MAAPRRRRSGGHAGGKDGTTTRDGRLPTEAAERLLAVVPLAVLIVIAAQALHEEPGEYIGKLRDEIGALRAERECRHQPDDCDGAELLAVRQRDR